VVDQDQIIRWLDEHGVSHEDAPLEPDSGYRWAIRTVSQPFSTVVAQREVDRPHLFFQVGIGVADEHRAVLDQLDETARGLFLLDLRIALYQQPVGHLIQVDPDDPSTPTVVTIGYNMLEEEPQRAGFFRRLHQMQTAAQLTSTFFKKLAHLGDWP
jgi:hypothetical protein